MLMKNILFVFILLPVTLFSQNFNIIPYPVKVEKHGGFFELKSSTVIIYEDNLYLRAKQLKEFLEPATGFNIKTGQNRKDTDQIVLRINGELEYLGNEGYVIEVNQNKIQIV